MPEQLQSWKRIDRKTIYSSKFLSLYEDTVGLPNGTIVDDYTVVSLPSGVIVVATDEDGRLITQTEYKYAIDKTILNFPSGSVEPGESPLEVARRELMEESGYQADEFVLVKSLYSDYPSKLTHVVHIVRATNARKVAQSVHEATETIGSVRLITSDMSDYGGEFDTTYAVSALALTIPEFLRSAR